MHRARNSDEACHMNCGCVQSSYSKGEASWLIVAQNGSSRLGWPMVVPQTKTPNVEHQGRPLARCGRLCRPVQVRASKSPGGPGTRAKSKLPMPTAANRGVGGPHREVKALLSKGTRGLAWASPGLAGVKGPWCYASAPGPPVPRHSASTGIRASEESSIYSARRTARSGPIG